MSHESTGHRGAVSRRGFFGAIGSGVVGGAGMAVGVFPFAQPPDSSVQATGVAVAPSPSPPVAKATSATRAGGQRPSADELTRAMPGPFPGRVIEVAHRGSVVEGEVREEPVRDMVRRGIKELFGADDPTDGWRRLFGKGDRVGIKVNPIGAPHAMSQHATVHAVVDGLKSAGVKPADILIFDRNRQPFLRAGYAQNLPAGCQWECAVESYDNVQLDIDGYDPDVFAEMELIHPRFQDPGDDRYRRSHLALIVSRKVDKIINVPALKDHRAAGVSLALKNMSHGFVNNVVRSHAGLTLNSCRVFIPTIVALPQLRSKVVLHVLDGLKGVFQNGPSADPQFVWEHKSLLIATDPVALDKIGCDHIDAERVRRGLAPVARCGRLGVPEPGDGGLDMRQPQHIDQAGALGLGVFDRDRIQHRRIELG